MLVAAYNEAASIQDTLVSIGLQNTRGSLQVIVINDGSRMKPQPLSERHSKNIPG